MREKKASSFILKKRKCFEYIKCLCFGLSLYKIMRKLICWFTRKIESLITRFNPNLSFVIKHFIVYTWKVKLSLSSLISIYLIFFRTNTSFMLLI